MKWKIEAFPFESQKALKIRFKMRTLKKEYIPDAVCHGQIIVELKTLERLTSKEDSQMLKYLKARGMRVGVLINFGSPDRLDWKRLIR